MRDRPSLTAALFRDKPLSRNFLLIVGLLLTTAAVAFAAVRPWTLWLLVPALPLTILAANDLIQAPHSLRRNYPVSARLRWFFEWLRPFVRSYLVESDLEGRPFSHDERSLVYARAKGDADGHPFGTELDVYARQYKWLAHSMAPSRTANGCPRVAVGSEQCSRPYQAARLNISAMSFGSLGGNAIEALNLGAKLGGFYHDSGEGGLSPHHLKHGGDLVWEIGSGYFGCRDKQGHFDPEAFRDEAHRDEVVMTEIKLSQGAKPGYGGFLPGAKVTQEIAQARSVPVGQDCASPAFHTAFSTPIELVEFAARLRDLSGGKPVGLKLCVGLPHELFAVVKAMLETGIMIDFLVIDGAEGGTGSAPIELSDHMGMPLREGLILARNALVGANLKPTIKLAAAGKVNSGASIAMNAALGADWCNAARAFMFSLGCVQSLRCHTDRCPTGVATQSPARQRGLVVPEKADRVVRFQKATLAAMHDIVVACGLDSPDDLTADLLLQRVSPMEMRAVDEVYHFAQPGELLDGAGDMRLAQWWAAADATSFSRRAA